MTSELATLPAWAPPATPAASVQSVGVDLSGQLYLYGETPKTKGPYIPSIVGCVVDLSIVQLAGGRDYLRVMLATGLPGECVYLQLSCAPRISMNTGQEVPVPTHVRSLLAGLQCLDLSATAVKLQTKRGTAAYAGVFFQVIPLVNGQELPEVRAPILGPTRNDLEIAVNGLRQSLGLPIQFPSINDNEP